MPSAPGRRSVMLLGHRQLQLGTVGAVQDGEQLLQLLVGQLHEAFDGLCHMHSFRVDE
jgi:hypothetical protein